MLSAVFLLCCSEFFGQSEADEHVPNVDAARSVLEPGSSSDLDDGRHQCNAERF
jgi:hypothetical protein